MKLLLFTGLLMVLIPGLGLTSFFLYKIIYLILTESTNCFSYLALLPIFGGILIFISFITMQIGDNNER